MRTMGCTFLREIWIGMASGFIYLKEIYMLEFEFYKKIGPDFEKAAESVPS